jgi:multicomponent Na+:H+ antiporter subunit G
MSLLSSVMLIIGCSLLLVAALGVFRMPDLYIRMSASSKAMTLGIGCLAVALALHVNDAAVTTRAILLIVLFFLKAPVAAHILGRAAYITGVPLWEATKVDEMKGNGPATTHGAGCETSAAKERPAG